MQQLTTPKLWKKYAVIGCILFFLLLLGAAYFFFSSRQTKEQDILKSLSEKEQKQLSSIAGDLEKLNRIIEKNQNYLSDSAPLQSKTVENLSSLLTGLENLEKHLSQIDASISVQTLTSDENLHTLTEQCISMSETPQKIIDSITFSKETIMELMAELTSEQKKQHSSLLEKMNNLIASFSYIKSELQTYQTALSDLGKDIQKSMSENQSELLTAIKNAQEDIGILLTDKMLQLDIELEKNFLSLAEKMESIHIQILSAKESISTLLTGMQKDADKKQEEILSAFHQLQSDIGKISVDVDTSYTEIKSLIATLSETARENHVETLGELKNMENELLDFSQQSLLKITASIQDMQTGFESALFSMQTGINNSLQTLDTDLSTIINQYNADTANQLGTLQTTIDTQYSSLANIMNSSDSQLQQYIENSMKTVNQKLEQVFTYVSNGKSKLASALLTKGVNCSQDASFAEIHQAILDIPQKLVIGTEELPGEVSYEYHYHMDKNGQTPHTEAHSEKGGCYTSPIYHIHTGDYVNGGGCYTKPVTHTHTDDCYSATKTERKVTGYWFTGQGTGHQCCDNAHGQNWARFRYEDTIYKDGSLISFNGGEGELGYCCALCINRKANEKGYASTNSSIICGYSEGLNGYDLGCGMTTGSVISYKPSCYFTDGQITGAHIIYQNSAAADAVSSVV